MGEGDGLLRILALTVSNNLFQGYIIETFTNSVLFVCCMGLFHIIVVLTFRIKRNTFISILLFNLSFVKCDQFVKVLILG